MSRIFLRYNYTIVIISAHPSHCRHARYLTLQVKSIDHKFKLRFLHNMLVLLKTMLLIYSPCMSHTINISTCFKIQSRYYQHCFNICYFVYNILLKYFINLLRTLEMTFSIQYYSVMMYSNLI